MRDGMCFLYSEIPLGPPCIKGEAKPAARSPFDKGRRLSRASLYSPLCNRGAFIHPSCNGVISFSPL